MKLTDPISATGGVGGEFEFKNLKGSDNTVKKKKRTHNRYNREQTKCKEIFFFVYFIW